MMVDDLLDVIKAALKGKGAPARIEDALEEKTHFARDVLADMEREATFGERMADRVAQVGGSWAFVISFGVFLIAWAVLNVLILPAAGRFDPYPFIFLNLLLSMLAAVQAPIIMMSQNRQTAKDRAESRHDYEVNLKAELEIMTLHAKVDELTRINAEQFAELRRLLSSPTINT
jgi:uncharacterized membrane protein